MGKTFDFPRDFWVWYPIWVSRGYPLASHTNRLFAHLVGRNMDSNFQCYIGRKSQRKVSQSLVMLFHACLHLACNHVILHRITTRVTIFCGRVLHHIWVCQSNHYPAFFMWIVHTMLIFIRQCYIERKKGYRIQIICYIYVRLGY